MRCKNCGFDNEEGRYICANCGSPLYDDNDEIIVEEKQTPNTEPVPDSGEHNLPSDDEEKLKNKKSIIIIIVLAVILVAMIVGITVSALTGRNKESTTESTSISSETDTQRTTRKRNTTEKETTTEATTTTTETTTQRTTEKTTARQFSVDVITTGTGSVSGNGLYSKGQKATLTASSISGWEFDGWYDSSGNKLSSNAKYTFTVNGNTSITAKFTEIQNTEAPGAEGDNNEQG